jgi:hypothetical protein
MFDKFWLKIACKLVFPMFGMPKNRHILRGPFFELKIKNEGIKNQFRFLNRPAYSFLKRSTNCLTKRLDNAPIAKMDKNSMGRIFSMPMILP